MASKSDIRRQISIFKHETEAMMVDFAGDVIDYKVMALEEYKNANSIFIYVDYNKEVKTSLIIEDALKSGKNVAVPRVYSHEVGADEKSSKYMKFHYISSRDELEKGYNGLLEPMVDAPLADGDTENALMVMPMVAFDGDRNRVGYGGGFYDKYLNCHNFAFKLGLAFEEQKVEAIDDKEEYDVKPDMIVTEKNIYK